MACAASDYRFSLHLIFMCATCVNVSFIVLLTFATCFCVLSQRVHPPHPLLELLDAETIAEQPTFDADTH